VVAQLRILRSRSRK